MNQYWNMLQRYTAIESILGKKIISHALDCTGHKMWLILLKIGQNCPKKTETLQKDLRRVCILEAGKLAI